MIVVNVHLDSAISRTRDKELARVHIANVGGTDELGDYRATSLRGRSTEQLDQGIINRTGEVHGFARNREHVLARNREHVLNLVCKALIAMGYGK